MKAVATPELEIERVEWHSFNRMMI